MTRVANKNETTWYNNIQNFLSYYFFNYILNHEVESIQFRFVFNKKDPIEILKKSLFKGGNQNLTCSLRVEIAYKDQYSLPTLYKIIDAENIGRNECAKQFVQLCNMITFLNKKGWIKLYTHPLRKLRTPYGHYIPHAGSEYKFDGDIFHYNDIVIPSIAKLSGKEPSIVDALLINDVLKELADDIACKIENNEDRLMLDDINIDTLTGINSVDDLFDLLCLYNGLLTVENSRRLRVVQFDENEKIQISIRDLKILQKLYDKNSNAYDKNILTS